MKINIPTDFERKVIARGKAQPFTRFSTVLSPSDKKTSDLHQLFTGRGKRLHRFALATNQDPFHQ